MEHESFSQYLNSKVVGIVGVSIKEGQSLKGPETAPQEMRKSGLLEVVNSLNWTFNDYGDVSKENITIEESEDLEADNKKYKYPYVKNSRVIGAACRKLNSITNKIGLSRQFCLTLGGDHGIATGSISGLKSAYPDLKVIWIDAHADCNLPEDSHSGNYHGMPVAHLLGWIPDNSVPGFDWFKSCLSYDDIVYIGLRDLDPAEKINLKKYNIKFFTMNEVTREGIGPIVEKSLKYLLKDGKDHPIHISFDVDGIDPECAYGTGTKARGGLLYREAHFIIREVYSTRKLVGLDLVEINPLLDKPMERLFGDNKLVNGTETVCLGIDLIESALGNTLS